MENKQREKKIKKDPGEERGKHNQEQIWSVGLHLKCSLLHRNKAKEKKGESKQINALVRQKGSTVGDFPFSHHSVRYRNKSSPGCLLG